MVALAFYLGLAGLLTLEEAGVFLLPGDISLVAAGLHASPDRPFLLIAWIAGSTGMIAGASVLFHGVGQADALKRILPMRFRRLIRRHGIWGVFAARLVPGLRNATVFAASSARLRYSRFLIALVPAAFIWCGALLLLGWFGGAAMLAAFSSLHHSRILNVASLAVILAIVLFTFLRLRSRAEEQSKSRARRLAAK